MKKVLNCVQYILLRLFPTFYLVFTLCLFVKDVCQEFNRLDNFNFYLYLDGLAIALCFMFLGIVSLLRAFRSTIKASDVCKYLASIMAAVYILTCILNIIIRSKSSYSFDNTLSSFGSYISFPEAMSIVSLLIVIANGFLKDKSMKAKWVLTIVCALCLCVKESSSLLWLIQLGEAVNTRFIINLLVPVYSYVCTVIMSLAPQGLKDQKA